jgi:hypothetical protein
MQTVGKYSYPDRGTFTEALVLTEKAAKYQGILPNKDAAEALNYTVKKVIGGEIYKKFDDLEKFSLFKRGRGTIEITELGMAAIDPYDKTKALAAKNTALRNIKLIPDTFTQLKGELPDSNAFPSFLIKFMGINLIEAQNHAESIRKLLSEAFPILKEAGGAGWQPTSGGDKLPTHQEIGGTVDVASQSVSGELRTTYGSVVINNLDTLEIAEKYIELLRKQFAKPKQSKEDKKETA